MATATIGENLALDFFRRHEWPQIKRQLAQDFGIALGEGVEPDWSEPGTAIYWQRTVVREREQGIVEGKPFKRIVEQDYGWSQTNPLPANNASQIANYLRNGLRLLPPADEEGVEVEASEAAAPAGEPPKATYECWRHERGAFVAPTWKAYLRHCEHRKEAPESHPPPEVIARMADSEFYCLLHDVGFKNSWNAGRHVAAVTRRKGFHPSLADIKVKRDIEKGQPT